MPVPDKPVIPTAKINLNSLTESELKDDDYNLLLKALLEDAPIQVEISFGGKSKVFPCPQVKDAAIDVARSYTPSKAKSYAEKDEPNPVIDQIPELDGMVARLGDLIGA